MKTRDSVGRFTRESTEQEIRLKIPSLWSIAGYLLLFVILLPWLLLILKYAMRFNLIGKLMEIMDLSAAHSSYNGTTANGNENGAAKDPGNYWNEK